MSLIGKNIKKIRTLKKLNQSEFAKVLGLNRGNISAYEEERAEPKINTIIQIANIFGMSVDLLINNELTANELYSLNIVNQKLNEAHHFTSKPTTNIRRQGIGLVYISNYFEYLANHTKKDFIYNLPHIDLPINFKGTSRAFELSGSEMKYNQQGLHHGDIMLCQQSKLEVKSIEINKLYVVVNKNGITTKRLKKASQKQLTFESDDSNYNSQSDRLNDIVELWEVKGIYSTYISSPQVLEERMDSLEKRLQELEGLVN